jgi:hypothetical protein
MSALCHKRTSCEPPSKIKKTRLRLPGHPMPYSIFFTQTGNAIHGTYALIQ